MIRDRKSTENTTIAAACTITNGMCTAMGKSFEFYENVKPMKIYVAILHRGKQLLYFFCAASENFPMLNSIGVTAGHAQRRGHVRNDNPA
jgi:hypothetical protein